MIDSPPVMNTAANTPPAPRYATSAWKRAVDVSCIVLSLPLVLPLMAVTATAVRVVSRGPALLRQTRLGRGGKPFVLYKFRSMRLNCGGGLHADHLQRLIQTDQPLVKLDRLGDPRMIAGGGLLRACGLDELPQLWNVLRGDMSLVGPRPCLPEEYAYFPPRQRARFDTLPGLTGLWQVRGKNHATFREMIRMDIEYVQHASVWMDLRIMLQTPTVLLGELWLAIHRQGAAHPLAALQMPTRAPQATPSHRQLL